MGDIIHVCSLLFFSSTECYHARLTQLKAHAPIANNSLVDAGLASCFLATGLLTFINHDENTFVVIVTQPIAPGNTPSTVVLHGGFFVQPLPAVDHIVVVSRNVLSVCWAEAYLAVDELTVL